MILTSAIVEDRDFFVHRGAIGVVQNAQFWNESTFLERLRAAKEQGMAWGFRVLGF